MRARWQPQGLNDVKLIFSRKGFDKRNGGVASPIFPDGRICSLPIPFPQPVVGNVRYKEIQFGQINLGRLVSDLTSKSHKRLTGSSRAHLDPDIRKDALPRRAGWLAAFGQDSAARTHLAKNAIGVGDLFLILWVVS